MSGIITLEQEKANKCMGDINLVLKGYGLALSPSVKISTTGMTFHIDLVPVTVPTNLPAGSGKAGG